MSDKKLPRFVRLGNSCLKFNEEKGTYWRNAGMWGVKPIWIDDCLVSEYTHSPLIECTEAEFLADTRGYDE